jgi:hypothetical protein
MRRTTWLRNIWQTLGRVVPSDSRSHLIPQPRILESNGIRRATSEDIIWQAPPPPSA